MTTPWIDRYVPTEFRDVVGNTKSVRILSNLAESQKSSIPNLLICGPPGCGKTLCVDILCRELVTENRRSRILRLDSFHNREVDAIRTTVKNFARARVSTGEDSPRVRKILVLDEADSMTPGAFQALRRIMEVNSSTTRVIIVCNNSAKVIEPIQSRCAIVRFTKVDDASLRSRASAICDMANHAEYTPDGIEAISRVSDGDLRTATNVLSSTVSAFRRVTGENVYKICDTPQPTKIVEIIGLLKNKEYFVRACRKLQQICDDDGCSPTEVVSGFFKALPLVDLEGERGGEEQRIDIGRAIGFTQARVSSGTASYLQLASMMWRISNVISKKK